MICMDAVNPIEKAFNVYKGKLKKLENSALDWFHKHLITIQSISRDSCIKEFRHCIFPKSSHNFIYSSKENQNILLVIADSLIIF